MKKKNTWRRQGAATKMKINEPQGQKRETTQEDRIRQERGGEEAQARESREVGAYGDDQ